MGRLMNSNSIKIKSKVLYFWESRKEFEEMVQKDEYIEEAYDEPKKLSLDE